MRGNVACDKRVAVLQGSAPPVLFCKAQASLAPMLAPTICRGWRPRHPVKKANQNAEINKNRTQSARFLFEGFPSSRGELGLWRVFICKLMQGLCFYSTCSSSEKVRVTSPISLAVIIISIKLYELATSPSGYSTETSMPSPLTKTLQENAFMFATMKCFV